MESFIGIAKTVLKYKFLYIKSIVEFSQIKYLTFGQPCDFRVCAKCLLKCVLFNFTKTRGNNVYLKERGVLLPKTSSPSRSIQ